MSNLKETIDYRGMSINIYYDECYDNPDDWDNPDAFLCADYRDLSVDAESISAEECREAIGSGKYFLRGFYIFPVSIYDHSGIAVHLGDARGWDYSNGYAFVCVKRRKGWSWKKSIAERIAEGVLEGWNCALSGEVYRYEVTDASGDFIDSCCGFYGNDGLEEMVLDAKCAIDYELKRRHEEDMKAFKAALAKHIAKRKAQIKAHAPFYARTIFSF